MSYELFLAILISGPALSLTPFGSLGTLPAHPQSRSWHHCSP